MTGTPTDLFLVIRIGKAGNPTDVGIQCSLKGTVVTSVLEVWHVLFTKVTSMDKGKDLLT